MIPHHFLSCHCEAAYQAMPKQSQNLDCFVGPLGLLAVTASYLSLIESGGG